LPRVEKTTPPALTRRLEAALDPGRRGFVVSPGCSGWFARDDEEVPT